MTTNRPWTGSISEALERLSVFYKDAGISYQNNRNFDFGTEYNSTSALSPYISKGLIYEIEVIQKVLTEHTVNQAEKFIQEVFWRIYWKGWLEMRPSVWKNYINKLNVSKRELTSSNMLSDNYEKAISGKTGVDCFDFWSEELKQSGYLHNHARMWFASIWVFTLNLPWELGADFFYRNLLDADPASNTLSWRWVSGLQTKGKHYIATKENIRKFTNNRFNPKGLNESPNCLIEQEIYPLEILEDYEPSNYLKNSTINADIKNLIIFEEDLLSDFNDYKFIKDIENIFLITNSLIEQAYNINFSEKSKIFSNECILDLYSRLQSTYPKARITVINNFKDLEFIKNSKYSALKPKVGYYRDFLDQYLIDKVDLSIHVREIDTKLFPYAKKGFFSFKDCIKDFITATSSQIQL